VDSKADKRRQQAKLDALEAEYTELAEGEDEASDSETLQSIEGQIETLAGRAQYRQKDIATAGAFVALRRNREPQIERGFVRRDDEKPATEGAGDAPEQPKDGEAKPPSAALVAELTATRTLFLRDALASAMKLDIAKQWQPTVTNYLGRVSKERVLEAVREGASEQEAARLTPMKKQDMAAAAERLLAGKGWLPPLLRVS
jgi:hypothetical protein